MNGLPMFWRLTRLLAPILVGWGLLSPVPAAAGPQSAPPPREVSIPEPELLEFLGMFDDGEGETLNPMELLEFDEAQWQEISGKEADHEK